MSREAAYRLWMLVVGIAALGSGAVFWHLGERLAGGLGIATALAHLAWAACRLWRSGMRTGLALCTVHKSRRRRPIVIPRLRTGCNGATDG